MKKKPVTYAGTGVDYSQIDPFKVLAQRLAGETSGVIQHLGFKVLEWTRGESVFAMETPDSRVIALVEEGLGTKNKAADAMYKRTGDPKYYQKIAEDALAMIVNDMATLGVSPVSVAMHLAVGDSAWFADEKRYTALLEGWQHACRLAGCVWGPGETPTLKGVVAPDTFVLSGSAVGYAAFEQMLFNPQRINPDDAIVLIESSGIHANGLTLARSIGDRDGGEGYFQPMRDGRLFGDALLDPTHIYTRVVEECVRVGMRIHYAVNITGHGWRKLMRAPQPFTYTITKLPPVHPVFDHLIEHGPVALDEAYGNLNMGAGFALYVRPRDVPVIIEVAAKFGFRAFHAGHIKEGDRKVVIEPLNITYADLGVR